MDFLKIILVYEHWEMALIKDTVRIMNHGIKESEGTTKVI